MPEKKKGKRRAPSPEELIEKFRGQATSAWEQPRTADEVAATSRGDLEQAWGGGVDMAPYGPSGDQFSPGAMTDADRGGETRYARQLDSPRPDAKVIREAIQLLMRQLEGGG
jgi:hypothetical protein